MPVGIEVYNDHNTLLLSDQYLQFSLVKSGILRDGDFSPIYAQGSRALIDTTNMTSPLIFFRAMRSEDRLTTSASGDYATPTSAAIHKWHNLVLGEVEYFVFDRWRPPAGNYGLQLFSEDGALAYDSSWYTLNIVNVMTCPPGQPDLTGPNSYAILGDHGQGAMKVALGLPSPRVGLYTFNGNSVLQDCAWLSGNNVAISNVQILFDNTDSWPGAPLNTGPGLVFVIDVTGYPVPYR